MKADLILKNYEIAKERYAALGVDTDKAIETLEKTPISLHCWQADDVVGFERGEAASGGIQSTGNYPGKARNIDELRQDIEKVNSLLAGTFRLNLHEIYGEFGGKQIDRNEVTVDQFTGWMQWAKEQNMKLDFNSTSFSHPKSGSLSLSNPDPAIREFWIEHTKRCRRIADAMGKFQNDPCIMNIWVHDGSKDITVEKGRYREILKNSLDEILAEELPNMKSCLEAKLFGIGLEAYTVGSHDFYAAAYLALFQLTPQLRVDVPVGLHRPGVRLDAVFHQRLSQRLVLGGVKVQERIVCIEEDAIIFCHVSFPSLSFFEPPAALSGRGCGAV